jgi:hypothetical protein
VKEFAKSLRVLTRRIDLFLLAKLTMSNLYEQPTRQDLLEELNPQKLPTGLNEASVLRMDSLKSMKLAKLSQLFKSHNKNSRGVDRIWKKT